MPQRILNGCHPLRKINTCLPYVEFKLTKSNASAVCLKCIISRASHTCSSSSANRATSSNFLLTGNMSRALSHSISPRKGSLTHIGRFCARQMPEGFSTAKRDFRYKYCTFLRTSRPFIHLAVRFFPSTEKDSWYN